MSDIVQKITLTGATGFVGGAIAAKLAQYKNYQLCIATRRENQKFPINALVVKVGDLSQASTWINAIEGASVVIHSAARVHIMDDSAFDSLAEFRKVNVEGTLRLARLAVDAGVKRFIFISSIKVNGESTGINKPFYGDDKGSPVDPYGVSKKEAEIGLLALARDTGLEVVIIRPVLVYGPGVTANFLSMMRWVEKGIPLPLGAIDNRRSFVSIDNLVDLVLVCITHPAAINQTFLVSDGDDLSTTQLLQKMANALGKKSLLLPVPCWVIKNVACFLGKSSVAQRLCGSLQVDIAKTRLLLGWSPPVSVDDALKATARHFLKELSK